MQGIGFKFNSHVPITVIQTFWSLPLVISNTCPRKVGSLEVGQSEEKVVRCKGAFQKVFPMES